MNRKGFIGGSDVASILGLSPWKSAYALWEEKTTEFMEPEDVQREKVFRRGKKLEPIVIEMLQEERDVWITERNVIHVDAEYDFLRAEIDFGHMIDPDRNIIGNGDVKTVHPYAAADWGDEGTDQFPPYYAVQFQYGLGITPDRPSTLVAALIGADDLRVYQIPRDEEVIAWIRGAAIDFWFNNVIANVPPPIQTPEDADKMMRRFRGLTVPATDEVRAALRRRKGICAAIKRLEDAQQREELRVKTHMALHAKEGEPERFAIVGENGKPLVTWNVQERKGYTVGPAKFRVFRTTNAA